MIVVNSSMWSKSKGIRTSNMEMMEHFKTAIVQSKFPRPRKSRKMIQCADNYVYVEVRFAT